MEFDVEILDNGDIKITTGKFSPAIHTQADRFLEEVLKALHGTVTRTRRRLVAHNTPTREGVRNGD